MFDNLLEEIQKANKEYEQYRKEYEESADSLWNSLAYEDKVKMFYAVVKRIKKAELDDKGTFRYALYDVFEFKPDAYAAGIDCGYMELHNTISCADEYNKLKKEGKLPKE